MLLTDVFAVPHNYNLSPSKIRYWNSLVPQYSVLEKVKKITIVETFFDDKPEKGNWTPVKHQNCVNVHMFKPKYFVNEKGDELMAYCASKEIVAHTTRALSVICSCMYYINIEIEIIREEADFTKLQIGHLNENVVVCRISSYLDFLKIFYLLNSGVSKNSVKRHFIEKELKRLNSELKSDLHDQTEVIDGKKYDFFKIFKLELSPINSPYFQTANLVFDGVNLSLIQLPWGITLAKGILEEALDNNKVTKLGFIGGAGCIGKNHGGVDDIFVMNNVVLGNDYDGYEIKPLDNKVLSSPENKYFTDKNIVYGNIKTVVPKLGSLSTTAQYKNGLEFIFAFDMEFEGFYNVFKSRKLEYAAIHYYMDKENVGVELGDTYYYEPFLRELFSNFNRGKYYCFEKISNWILTQ